jgi:ABC-type sugar transport system substrate-binding protein
MTDNSEAEQGSGVELFTRRAMLQLGAAATALPAMAALLASCSSPKPNPAHLTGNEAPSSKPRKLVWIPQAAGDWEVPIRIGQMEFCRMVNWDYQHIGNPVYSVQNHLDQLNEVISARPDVIVTELESEGMVSGFQRALDKGITMVVIDQAINEEAAKLGLGVISQDPLALGTLNGTQAATWAEKISGRKEGVILIGNGNPGSALIDALQSSTQAGVAAYNRDHGTNFVTETFADSAFDDIATSMSKYSAHMQQKGDSLVALVGLGGASAIAIWKTMRENDIPPGKQIAAGSTDIFPDQQTGIEEGYLQWGIDQEFLVMGFLSVAGAWLQIEHGYPCWSMRTPGQVISKANVAQARARTELWIQRAKELNLIAS